MTNLPANEAFNIIVIGAWNPHIFSPEWVKKNLAEDQSKEVVLAIPMQMHINMAPRLTVDDVNLYPSTQSLTLDSIEFDGNAFHSTSAKLRKISDLLPHTPVSAVGVNFRYEFSQTEALNLNALFTFDDAANIDATKYKLAESGIRRTFVISDETTLNLTINLTNESYKCEFNFHTPAFDLSTIGKKITAELIQKFHKQSKDFLLETYQIQFD